ncbi:N-6 DNA methylase [Chlorobium phaeobacteroides]|uniref:N-6 DNA methylase n=1 Tax=Chlorobium phaeobacteroides TaxID=1096 RepID=UPI001CC1AA21|nr:N-6 DNA methylase [Chlorobium phaeobacteroides]
MKSLIVSLPGGVFTAAGAGVKTNHLFFSKGQSTRKIWYYDLSSIKVGKKTPLTIKTFEEFFRLLPERPDSELSWTINMDERKQKAAEEACPFKEKATATSQKVAQLSERLKELKKTFARKSKVIEEAEKMIADLTREARTNAAKAKEIQDAVYDLKAVNPNKKADTDNHTPEDLLDIIETKGREIAEALAVLRIGLSIS